MFVFPCKDGVVQLGLQAHQWPKLTKMTGFPELTEDPRFRDHLARLKDENASLRARQESLVSERAELIEKTELARNRVEAMISRLKAMEEGV